MARIFFSTSTQLAAGATFTSGTAGNGGVDGVGDAPGQARDAGAWNEANRFGAVVNSDVAGTLYIDGSYDKTTWRQQGSAAVAGGTAVDLDVPVRYRYYRTRYVNGATQTGAGAFAIHSSFRSAS